MEGALPLPFGLEPLQPILGLLGRRVRKSGVRAGSPRTGRVPQAGSWNHIPTRQLSHLSLRVTDSFNVAHSFIHSFRTTQYSGSLIYSLGVTHSFI